MAIMEIKLIRFMSLQNSGKKASESDSTSQIKFISIYPTARALFWAASTL
jgi:hypothetical protein